MPPMDDLSRTSPPPPAPLRPVTPPARQCRCTWQFLAGVLAGLLLAAATLGVMGGACRPDPAPSGGEDGTPVDEPYEPPTPPIKAATPVQVDAVPVPVAAKDGAP